METMIQVNELTKVFKTDEVETWALDKVNIEIGQGEFVAVMGPSGCGKSTLLHILGLLDSPSSGQYLLDGKDVSSCSESKRNELRKGMLGFVFQSFNLIDELTVQENIALPLLYMGVPKQERQRRVEEAMARMDIMHRSRHYPRQISGGQQQRTAIARAIVTRPKLILADEPTGNLDSATGALVMETFHKLQKRGKTIVLITHDPGIAAEADRAVTIRDGRIHDGAYIPHAPRTLRSAVDSLPMISASANPPKGVVA